MATIPPTPRATDWSPAEGSPVLGQGSIYVDSASPGRLSGRPILELRIMAVRLGRALACPTPARPRASSPGMPLDEQIARQITATDPTSRAIHSQRLEGEAKKQLRPKPLPRRRR
jgi:hypothetical protein